MDAFKDFLQLDHILRNCLGGVAFYFIIYREIQSDYDVSGYLLSTPIPWANLTAILIVVSLTGILLHAIERNTVAIITENVRGWVIDKEIGLNLLFPEKAKKEAIWRFQQLTEKEKWIRLNSWGASAHCLYTVSLAIFAATLYLLFDNPSDCSFCCFLSYFPIEFIFLLLGFFSDVRKTLMESGLSEHPKSMEKKGIV